MNTKKKFFYSLGAKVLVLVLLFAGIASVATGVGMGEKIADTGVSLEDALQGTEFSKTYYVTRQAIHYGMNGLLSEQQENLYKTDGAYDMNATVDITKMQSGVSASDKNPDTTYTMQDLLTLYENENAKKTLRGLAENSYSEMGLIDQFTDKVDLYYAGSDGKVYGTSNMDFVDSVDEALQQLREEYQDGGDVSYEAIYQLNQDGTVTRLQWQNSSSKNTTGGTQNHTGNRASDTTSDDTAATESAASESSDTTSTTANTDSAATDNGTGNSNTVSATANTDSTSSAVTAEAAGVTLTNIESREAYGRLLVDLDTVNQQNHTSYEYSDYGETFWRMYENGIKSEVVLPQSGNTLASYALKNPSDVSILDTYKELLDAADTIGKVVSDSDSQTQTSEDETTVPLAYYWYQNTNTGELYTNNSVWRSKTYSQLKEEYVENQDIPVIFYSRSEEGKNNIHVSSMLNKSSYASHAEDFFLSYLDEEGNGSLNTAYSQVIISLNPEAVQSPQLENYFGSAPQAYATYIGSNSVKIAVILVAAGAVLALICLICALLQAGRKDNRKEKYAGVVIRKIPVEILLIIDIVLWVILAGICAVFGNRDLFETTVILYVVFAGGGIALFVCELLTFVTKCKSGNFLTNSLIKRFGGKFVEFVKTVYQNRSVTGKMILCFILFLIISIIGTVFAYSRMGMGVLILILLWIALFILLMRKVVQKQTIKESIHEIAGGNLDYQTDVSRLSGDDLEMAENLNRVRDGMQKALNEQMKSERLKTDLITNVSHDIKTPLTSIINYVDILKRENIQDEKIRGYIDVLDRKSQRLKHLTEDLVEASKISSGNIRLDIQTINLKQLIKQTNGEFEEKFESRQLSMVCNLPEEEMLIQADGRRMWRVIENLYNNAAKYAMPGSRIYVDGICAAGKVVVTIKNISESPLNFDAEELMERFVRGDVSRNTEGSGLGLEIARNLTVMMQGKFDIYLDGDLFKVILTFDQVQKEPEPAGKEQGQTISDDEK